VSRTRSLCAVAVTVLALAGAAPAQAGSKWSPAKCQHAVTKLSKKYPTTVGPKVTQHRAQQNSKKLNKALKKLQTQHGCVIGG
jgi:hypothetical protein